MFRTFTLAKDGTLAKKGTLSQRFSLAISNRLHSSIAVRRRADIPSNSPSILRSSPNRHLHRGNVIPLFFAHFLSSSSLPPSPENNTASKNPLPISPIKPAQSKPKIDLRPGPIKPNASTSYTPSKPAHISYRPPSPSPHIPSLGVKKAAKRDIEAAEQHGILIPPPPDANWFKKTLHKVIQLFKFYFRGVKLIFTRRTEVVNIKSRVRGGGVPLTRAENRFIRTQQEDVNKVIPFLFIALLLEEIIPLIVIYAPFMLPSTCILPSQRDRIAEKKAEKAILFSYLYRDVYDRVVQHEEPEAHLSLNSLRNKESSIAICGLLRLSTIGFHSLRVRRIRRHLEFIGKDDKLLIQDNLLSRLSEEELNEALEERGIITQGLSLKDKVSRLKWWIDSISRPIQGNPVSRKLLLLVQRQ